MMPLAVILGYNTVEAMSVEWLIAIKCQFHHLMNATP